MTEPPANGSAFTGPDLDGLAGVFWAVVALPVSLLACGVAEIVRAGRRSADW